MRKQLNLKKAFQVKQKRKPILTHIPQIPARKPIRVVCVCAGGVMSSGNVANAFRKAITTEKQPFEIETAGFYIPQHHNMIRGADVILSEIKPETLRHVFQSFGIRTLAKIHYARPNPKAMAKLKETILAERHA